MLVVDLDSGADRRLERNGGIAHLRTAQITANLIQRNANNVCSEKCLGKGTLMIRQSVPRRRLRLGMLLGSAFVLMAVSAPASANGRNLTQTDSSPRPKGMLVAGMGEMGAANMGNDSKPGGMGGGMKSDAPCCVDVMGAAPGAGTSMAMPSALPGFAGASHLYHVGSTGFFLDYADKIGLSVEQRTALNGIKQRLLAEQAAYDRKAAEAEQALWSLTAAAQPDAAAIDGKVREIEKLKSDQRLAFIRAVGEAMMGAGPKHTEGRLVFIKTELKITDPQMPQWNAFADAVRANATAMTDMRQAMAPQQKPGSTLPERLAMEDKVLSAHFAAFKKIQESLTKLYDVLSPDQKKIADGIVIGPMGMPMGMM